MDVFFIYYMTEYFTNYYYIIINNTDIIGSSDSPVPGGTTSGIDQWRSPPLGGI